MALVDLNGASSRLTARHIARQEISFIIRSL